MQLKSILNRVQKHKCFVYEEVSAAERAVKMEVREAVLAGGVNLAFQPKTFTLGCRVAEVP
jgi:hypothetical protein